MNKTYPWGDPLPYNSLAERFKKKWGGRVQKISLQSGFTCPNRDGSLGVGGCTFCNNESFVPSYTRNCPDPMMQIDEGLRFLEKLYKRTSFFVGYFQAYTNTYGDFDQIKRLYRQVLSHPRIQGLVIGTRPDCIDQKLLDFFSELAQDYFIEVEYGVESCRNDILQSVNRGHTFECSVEAIEKTAGRGIHTGAHFMFGFPGDTKDSMLEQARTISDLPLTSVKFHQLQIVKNTIMAQQYAENPENFHLFEEAEYLDFIVDFTERLHPAISIERFCSEVPPRIQIAPVWSGRRIPELTRAIIARMEERNTWQGRLFKI